MWKSLDKRVAAFLLEESAIEGSAGYRFYDAVTHDRCLIERAAACGMDQ